MSLPRSTLASSWILFNSPFTKRQFVWMWRDFEMSFFFIHSPLMSATFQSTVFVFVYWRPALAMRTMVYWMLWGWKDNTIKKEIKHTLSRCPLTQWWLTILTNKTLLIMAIMTRYMITRNMVDNHMMECQATRYKTKVCYKQTDSQLQWSEVFLEV